ncbi:MAG: Rrf2 family transcriptional regulator [Chitinophagaceae bacterium]|nr:Rrf2 family transcriptional regulator [Chitinophagaceae bacterium]
MNNTRFATAIHIMTLLADTPDEWLGSDFLADSININPVMVRREIGILQNASLVITRRGKDGGTKLNGPSKTIHLDEIYTAVRNNDILGKKNKNPNPKCKIGKQINKQLDRLTEKTDQLVEDFLREITLADFTKRF